MLDMTVMSEYTQKTYPNFRDVGIQAAQVGLQFEVIEAIYGMMQEIKSM
jgi:hypothetical protein